MDTLVKASHLTSRYVKAEGHKRGLKLDEISQLCLEQERYSEGRGTYRIAQEELISSIPFH